MCHSQTRWIPFSYRRPYNSIEITLNNEASSSDSAGIHAYSNDIIHLVVQDETGLDYINSLSKRLSKKEEAVRGGKGHLVPETDVVRAYNDLMLRIGAPKSVAVDETAVREFRSHVADVRAFPALLSVDRNEVKCKPGEAVYLLYLLIESDGKLSNSYLDQKIELKQELTSHPAAGSSPPRRTATIITGPFPPNASTTLSAYCQQHGRHATVKLYDQFFKSLGL